MKNIAMAKLRVAFAHTFGALLGVLLLVLQLIVAPVQAQDAAFTGKIPADVLDAPKAEKGKKPQPAKLRPPACPECQEAYDRLKNALESYSMLQKADAAAKMKAAGELETGPEKTKAFGAGEAERNSANANLEIIDPGGRDPERQKRHDERASNSTNYANLTDLGKIIPGLIDAYKGCKCWPKPNIALPKLPECFKTAEEKKEFLERVNKIAFGYGLDAMEASRGRETLVGTDPNWAEWAQAAANARAASDLYEQAEKKDGCPPPGAGKARTMKKVAKGKAEKKEAEGSRSNIGIPLQVIETGIGFGLRGGRERDRFRRERD